MLAVAGADSDSEVPMKVGRRRARRAHGCLDKRACWLGGLSTSEYPLVLNAQTRCEHPQFFVHELKELCQFLYWRGVVSVSLDTKVREREKGLLSVQR